MNYVEIKCVEVEKATLEETHTTEEERNDVAEIRSSNEQRKRAIGAGVTTGLCGFLVGGPIVGTALGIGAGYAANQDQGPVGEASRKVGDFALDAEKRATEIEERHHVMEKVNTFLLKLWDSLIKTVNDCGEFWLPSTEKQE